MIHRCMEGMPARNGISYEFRGGSGFRLIFRFGNRMWYLRHRGKHEAPESTKRWLAEWMAM